MTSQKALSELEAARQRAEAELARYRDLFENAPDGYLVLDAEGVIQAANQRAVALLGSSLANVLQQPLTRFVSGAERADLSARLRVAREGRGSLDHEELHLRLRGEGPDVALTMASEFDAAGGIRRLRCLLRDITERQEVAARLGQAGRLAAIGELAAGVAHEVNNPVNTIINCAQLILDGDEDPTLCEDIMHEGERIADIVQGLLDFARDKDEEFHPTDMKRVIARTLALVQRRIEKDGIQLVVQLRDDLPPARARFQQMEQVLLNLLLNSRDALANHPWTGREIRLMSNLGSWQNGQPCVRVSVWDNGPGIAKEDLDRVLQPFFTTKRERGGTGLGLSVSHGIVESHGGSMHIASVPGVSTEVTVELPLAGDARGVTAGTNTSEDHG